MNLEKADLEFAVENGSIASGALKQVIIVYFSFSNTFFKAMENQNHDAASVEKLLTMYNMPKTSVIMIFASRSSQGKCWISEF